MSIFCSNLEFSIKAMVASFEEVLSNLKASLEAGADPNAPEQQAEAELLKEIAHSIKGTAEVYNKYCTTTEGAG